MPYSTDYKAQKLSSTDIVEVRFAEVPDDDNDLIDQFLVSEYRDFEFKGISSRVIDFDEDPDSDYPFIYVIRVDKVHL